MEVDIFGKLFLFDHATTNRPSFHLRAIGCVICAGTMFVKNLYFLPFWIRGVTYIHELLRICDHSICFNSFYICFNNWCIYCCKYLINCNEYETIAIVSVGAAFVSTIVPYAYATTIVVAEMYAIIDETYATVPKIILQ